MDRLNFDILDRIAQNDTAAMQLLQKHMQEPIMRYARKHSRVSLTTQQLVDFFWEVCSEVFATYHKNQATLLSRENNNFQGYFQTTANHHLIKFVKRLEKERNKDDPNEHLVLADKAKTPFEQMALTDDILLLNRCLDTLGANCKQLIEAHYFDEQKLVKIAEERGEKEGTIRQQLKRCLAKLREMMTQK